MQYLDAVGGLRLVAVGVILLLLGSVSVVGRPSAARRGLLWAGLVFSVAAIVLATLGDGLTSAPQRSVNLVPLASIWKQLSLNPNRVLVAMNLLGNIALLCPLGFFGAALLERMNRRGLGGLFTMLAGAVGVGVVVELAQLAVGGRAFDVDDILLNTTGFVVGASTYLGLRRSVRGADRSRHGVAGLRRPPLAPGGG